VPNLLKTISFCIEKKQAEKLLLQDIFFTKLVALAEEMKLNAKEWKMIV
jgi:hypothetical protein